MRSGLLSLILICASWGLCSCKASPESETATAQPTTIGVPSPTPSNTPMATPSLTTQTADDFLMSAQIIKGDTIKKDDDYEVRVEYPQLKRPTTHSEKQFNQYVKTFVEKEVRGFEAFCRKEKRQRKKFLGYHLGLTYSLTIASHNLLCLNLRWESYTGYVNSDWYTTTINYDLEKGRELRLIDLFKPKSNYLGALSKVGLRVLKKTCLSCGCNGVSAGGRLPDGVENPDDMGFTPLKEAVAPKLENFELWSLTDEGIEITFDEYEIAPGCAGIISITLPFEDLKPAIRDELLTGKF